jgi:hypothetical protein
MSVSENLRLAIERLEAAQRAGDTAAMAVMQHEKLTDEEKHDLLAPIVSQHNLVKLALRRVQRELEVNNGKA